MSELEGMRYFSMRVYSIDLSICLTMSRLKPYLVVVYESAKLFFLVYARFIHSFSCADTAPKCTYRHVQILTDFSGNDTRNLTRGG